jgi:hypothetical protein
MSMATPPSSGLSLIIHSLIIGVACFGRILGRHVPHNVSEAVTFEVPEQIMDPCKRALSIAIIVVLVIATIVFTGTAITTGIREGAQEPHVLFLGKVLGTTGDYVRSGVMSIPTLFTEQMTYVRKVSYLDFTRCDSSRRSLLCVN